MTGEQLAQSLIERISSELENIFSKSLNRPIHLYYKVGECDEKRKWPTSWGPEPTQFGLGIHDEFDLVNTWWNVKGVSEKVLRSATTEQKYLLTLSHELVHIYMFPTPFVAWFQETIAMKIGMDIAIKLDPTLEELFSKDLPEVTISYLKKYTYQLISTDENACRELQLLALSLGSRFSTKQLVEWVSANSPERYNPMKDERDPEEVERQIIETMPLN